MTQTKMHTHTHLFSQLWEPFTARKTLQRCSLVCLTIVASMMVFSVYASPCEPVIDQQLEFVSQNAEELIFMGNIRCKISKKIKKSSTLDLLDLRKLQIFKEH